MNKNRQTQTFWERIQIIDRRYLYLILLLCTSIPILYKNLIIPTQCKEATINFYEDLMRIRQGGTILLQSDWTNSTKGENAGQLEALLRIIHTKKLKFALYSLTDPQAPIVARNVIFNINKELQENGEKPFEEWKDWVDLSFFPDPSSFLMALVLDVKKALELVQSVTPQGKKANVMKSPVFQNIKKIEDISMLISVSGTGILRTNIERNQQPQKVKLAAMVTGVIGPETLNFYTAKQIIGVVVGLRGTVELETLMQYGINWPNKDGLIEIKTPDGKRTSPLKSKVIYGRGMSYYLALHTALGAMILAIIIGNIGMLMQKRKNKKRGLNNRLFTS